MAIEPDIRWTGASGRHYNFWKYEIGKGFKADAVGVYIFARKTSTGYDAVYIGQGILNDRLRTHENDGCVIRKGATEIHCCSVSTQEVRRQMERDLLAGNPEAYVPTGCNEKLGG